MKTLLFSIVFVLAAAFGFASTSFAQLNSFVVCNQQSQDLGLVTVSSMSGNTFVPVPPNSTDTTPMMDSSATSVTIAGQTVPEGQQAIVTLMNGTQVGVVWQSPTMVVVVDKDELQ